MTASGDFLSELVRWICHTRLCQQIMVHHNPADIYIHNHSTCISVPKKLGIMWSLLFPIKVMGVGMIGRRPSESSWYSSKRNTMSGRNIQACFNHIHCMIPNLTCKSVLILQYNRIYTYARDCSPLKQKIKQKKQRHPRDNICNTIPGLLDMLRSPQPRNQDSPCLDPQFRATDPLRHGPKVGAHWWEVVTTWALRPLACSSPACQGVPPAPTY